jgi:hypothetical protein
MQGPGLGTNRQQLGVHPMTTREDKILALTQNEIDWFLGNGVELNLVQEVIEFFAKGGYTAWPDEKIDDAYSRLTA